MGKTSLCNTIRDIYSPANLDKSKRELERKKEEEKEKVCFALFFPRHLHNYTRILSHSCAHAYLRRQKKPSVSCME